MLATLHVCSHSIINAISIILIYKWVVDKSFAQDSTTNWKISDLNQICLIT